jgi:DNA-binding transcriptional MerR regulator
MTLNEPRQPKDTEDSLHEVGTDHVAESDAAADAAADEDKAPSAYRTISEVSALLAVPQHVLRFWETKFAPLRPMKRGGGRRYYRPEDVTLLTKIKGWLYEEGLTIKGAQKRLKGRGIRQALAENEASPTGTGSAAARIPESTRYALMDVLAELRVMRDELA